jgi:hypothetical protein
VTAYGPGTALLATLTGRDPETVATDAGVALRAIGDLLKETARLAVDTSSPDPLVREAAQRRVVEIKALAGMHTDSRNGGGTPCP